MVPKSCVSETDSWLLVLVSCDMADCSDTVVVVKYAYASMFMSLCVAELA